MNTIYKDHDIEAIATLIPDTVRWAVKISINWTEGDKEEFRRFYGPPAGFKSKPEAERWGMQFAGQWIDDGKPDLHKS
jgi:hypothetical protein